MFDTLTTEEKVLGGGVLLGLGLLAFVKPARNAVGLADRTRTKKTKDLKVNRKIKDSKPYRHTYMMLGRLKSDNEYYLGHGNRSENRLWAGNVKDQIAEMKRLYNELPKHLKPEWLSMTDINNYAKQMK